MSERGSNNGTVDCQTQILKALSHLLQRLVSTDSGNGSSEHSSDIVSDHNTGLNLHMKVI